MDNILQNLWRCVSMNLQISEEDWTFLEAEASNWRPGRRVEIAQAKAAQLALEQLQAEWAQADAELHTPSPAIGGSDALRRLAAAQLSSKMSTLAASIQTGRQAAAEAGSRYN